MPRPARLRRRGLGFLAQAAPGRALDAAAFRRGLPGLLSPRRGAATLHVVTGLVKESGVTNTVDALILDLLEWIGPKPRAYAEVMEAWRTSCPRLPVWEEANARGFVERRHAAGQAALIAVTA